jgi:glucokinase
MFIGIDIGGTNIKAVLTDSNGKTLSSGNCPTPGTPEKIDTAILSLVDSLAVNAGIAREKIDAIGIGAAGSIDRRKGSVITSPNILCWKNYPLAMNIETVSGIKTFLENDATVACAGFWWDRQGEKNLVMVTLGTGIGGGAVIDGRLFSGQNGSSLEIGHMTVDINGRQCTCGNRGCMEQYASATALVYYVKSRLKKYGESSLHKRIEKEKLSAKMIAEEAMKKDSLSVMAFDELSYYLGTGIANIINILNPESVVLGGGLSKAHKLIIPRIKKVVNERAMKGMKEKVRFLAVKNESVIPALGAAKIAMDRLKHIL